jgi:flagellar motility protein MotE (MotC chaperone)
MKIYPLRKTYNISSFPLYKLSELFYQGIKHTFICKDLKKIVVLLLLLFWMVDIFAFTADKSKEFKDNRSEEKLIKQLYEKELFLQKREDDLKKKEDQLKINQEDFSKKIKMIQDEQNKILDCVKKNEEEMESRAAQIVTIISNMKPIKASEIMSVQDLEVAVKIMSKLDPIKSSKIFNLMDKEISARIQKTYLRMKK